MVAKDQLKAFIERVERLEEEKKALSDDIRDVYLEAKGNGFDVKALRTIVRLRKIDAAERAEQEAILETYMHALGMLSDLPLGQAAIERATKPPARTVASAAPKSEQVDLEEAIDEKVRKAAASPAVRAAVKKLGTPVELTDEERAKGYSAAFIGKDGTRMSIGIPLPDNGGIPDFLRREKADA